MTLGPAVREGEQVFGVAHIYASFNDTFLVSIACVLGAFEFIVSLTLAEVNFPG